VSVSSTTANQSPRTPTIEDLIGGAPKLPAAFQILPRMMSLLDDHEVDCSDLAELIRIDSSLTAAVFRVSNSARFAGHGPAHSLSQAIVRLGFREVFRVILEVITAPALRDPDASLFGRVDLWRHSLATAVASQVLAERLTKQDPEIAFSAGLLHDIGKTILIRAAREKYAQLLARCADDNRSVKFAEWELFGTDHAAIGGDLLRTWKFPSRIASVVAAHHRPESASTDHQSLAALVYVGNIVAYKVGVGNGSPPYVASPDRDALRFIGLARENLSDFNNEILERVQREQDRL
jgi:putative nucleotidyltransferase with HDIG domain